VRDIDVSGLIFPGVEACGDVEVRSEVCAAGNVYELIGAGIRLLVLEVEYLVCLVICIDSIYIVIVEDDTVGMVLDYGISKIPGDPGRLIDEREVIQDDAEYRVSRYRVIYRSIREYVIEFE
jgi:hypothetical protein